ncbi:MAG TPA: ADP-ribosylglycohydrolase family protein, partial [Blastocatellia bacterium]|nr:ADP-ribosylglycohydrolase family protein [Blastocatellia bacterium]
MKKVFVILPALGLLLIVAALAQPKTRSLSVAVLKDKIKGGWAGQMIGVSFGAPTEFKHNGKIIEGDLPWKPER